MGKKQIEIFIHNTHKMKPLTYWVIISIAAKRLQLEIQLWKWDIYTRYG